MLNDTMNNIDHFDDGISVIVHPPANSDQSRTNSDLQPIRKKGGCINIKTCKLISLNTIALVSIVACFILIGIHPECDFSSPLTNIISMWVGVYGSLFVNKFKK